MNILPLKLKFKGINFLRGLVRSMSSSVGNCISCEMFEISRSNYWIQHIIAPCYCVVVRSRHSTKLTIEIDSFKAAPLLCNFIVDIKEGRISCQ